jgi:hypothetical protein
VFPVKANHDRALIEAVLDYGARAACLLLPAPFIGNHLWRLPLVDKEGVGAGQRLS